MRLQATERPGFYRVLGGPTGIETFVASSEAGRAVLNDALLVGAAFQRRLEEAVTEALRGLLAADPPLAEALRQDNPAVLHILRGGLNFGTHGAVEAAVGRPCRVGFVSATRSVADGAAVVEWGAYEQLDDWGGAVAVIGDIAATGATLCRVLRRLSAAWLRARAPGRVVVVAIATTQAVCRIAQAFLALVASGGLPAPPILTVVALEGLFTVYEGREALEFHRAHTDFLRRGGVLTPEFTAASFRRPHSILERCVIYDGGARGFSPDTHLAGLLAYWSDLVGMFTARRGRIREHLYAKVDIVGLDRPFDAWLGQREHWARLAAHSLSNVYADGRLLASRDGDDLLDACAAHLAKVRSAAWTPHGDHR